jgi:ABC-type branched-subunit amino acid transport system substrate-binding protein
MDHVFRSAVVLYFFLGLTFVFAETSIGNDTIIIGQSAAFSGPAAELGREMREGALTYFEYINAQGGVNGRKIKLVSLDDGYEPDKALANTKKLLEQENVFALFGYVGTPTSYAVLPKISSAKVPFVGAFTGAEGLRNPVNPYVFNIRASYNDETERLVAWLVSLNKKRIAVFYQNDSYGKAGLAGVKKAMQQRGLSITASDTVERNSAAVGHAVKTLIASSPDAVIMISAYHSCAAFIKEAKKAAVGRTNQIDYLNVSFVGSRALASALGDDAHGVYVSQVMPYPWGPFSPVVVEFRERLSKYSPEGAVSFNNLEGYIAAKVFVAGLEKAGRNLTRASFISALESTDTDVGGFRVAFSPQNHNGSQFVQISLILGANGTFVYLSDPTVNVANKASSIIHNMNMREKNPGVSATAVRTSSPVQ